MKLYVYDHCPFCVRARMILGLKNIEAEIIYLANDDEETPIKMIGKKMLPILQTDNNIFIGESLDIVTYVDEQFATPCLTLPENKSIEEWVNAASGTIFKLAIPRWAFTGYPEFAHDSARQYFTAKKEAVFGSFTDLMKDSHIFIDDINEKLLELDTLLADSPQATEAWSMTDIILFPVIRALSIAEGVIWPVHVDQWRQRLAQQCGVDLEDDVAF